MKLRLDIPNKSDMQEESFIRNLKHSSDSWKLIEKLIIIDKVKMKYDDMIMNNL